MIATMLRIGNIMLSSQSRYDVVDDGGGMKPGNAAIGFGITGMQERVALLGGTISIGNRSDGKGVVVSARLAFQMPPEFPARKVEEAFSA